MFVVHIAPQKMTFELSQSNKDKLSAHLKIALGSYPFVPTPDCLTSRMVVQDEDSMSTDLKSRPGCFFDSPMHVWLM